MGNVHTHIWWDREYAYRLLQSQVLFALANTRELKVFRFPHSISGYLPLRGQYTFSFRLTPKNEKVFDSSSRFDLLIAHASQAVGGNRGLPLSVTHNFLVKICATPTRAVALRLSIPPSPHRANKNKHSFRVFIFVYVDLIVESWNIFYSWVFDASEAITERSRLENNLVCAEL